MQAARDPGRRIHSCHGGGRPHDSESAIQVLALQY
jgi:hypothetical protein